jgi:hypothetical protein
MDNLINNLSKLSMSYPDSKNEIDDLCNIMKNISIDEDNIDDVMLNLSKLDLSNLDNPIPIECINIIKDYFCFLYKKTKCMNKIIIENFNCVY